MVKNPISILPRVWEKDTTAICWLVYIGSLPLAWEKAFVRKRYSTSARNTPTRVGKKKLLLRSLVPKLGTLPLAWEKEYWIYCSGNSFGGSLPRVWEKALIACKLSLLSRITPTCVGKRLSIHGQNKHFEFILSWNFLQQIPRISALSKSTHLHIVWKKIFAQKILYKVFCAFFCKEKTREFHPGFDTYYLFFQYLVFYCVNSAFNSFF